MILDDIGSFLLRLTIGILFLMGAWASGKNRHALKFTIGETALVFKSRPEVSPSSASSSWAPADSPSCSACFPASAPSA
jgi:hypothetical protein